MSAPSKAEAVKAAGAFLRFRKENPKAGTADLHARTAGQNDFLMHLGRLYEFPPSAPKFDGPWTAASIAAFIQEHAREID